MEDQAFVSQEFAALIAVIALGVGALLGLSFRRKPKPISESEYLNEIERRIIRQLIANHPDTVSKLHEESARIVNTIDEMRKLINALK